MKALLQAGRARRWREE